MSKYNQKSFSKMTNIPQSTISKYTTELKNQNYPFEYSDGGKVVYKQDDIAVFKELNTLLKDKLSKTINLSLSDAVHNVISNRETINYYERSNILPLENEIAATIPNTPQIFDPMEIVETLKDIHCYLRSAEQNRINQEESDLEIKFQNEQIISNQKKHEQLLTKRNDDMVFFYRENLKQGKEELEKQEKYHKELLNAINGNSSIRKAVKLKLKKVFIKKSSDR
jgi:hypothetical protein